MKLSLEQSLTRGLEFLADAQEKDGSFPIFMTDKSRDFARAVRQESPFPAMMVLNSLVNMESGGILQQISGQESQESMKVIHTILKKTSSFLLSQKSTHWTWNYWKRHSLDDQKLPYPDDLDDTALALAGLYSFDKKKVNGKAIAAFVQLLTTLEQQEGGPYRTWLVPETAPAIWKDIDVAVNANIGYFLSLLEVDLPKLTQFIEDAIDQDRCLSPYYFQSYPVWYFISRWYKGKQKEKIIRELVDKNHQGVWEKAPLPTALAAVTLMNLTTGLDHQRVRPLLQQGIDFLISSQRSDGSWPAYEFILGNLGAEQPLFTGADTITTAVCIEALALFFVRRQKTEDRRQTKTETQKKVSKNSYLVINSLNKKLEALPDPLRSVARKELEKTLVGDRDHQIILLPFLFRSMLTESCAAQVSDELCTRLAMANVFGWMAYTIYDDFLDGEGDPVLLSVANICLRELTVLFHEALPGNAEYQRYYQSVLHTIDKANTWEIINTRIQLPPFQGGIKGGLPLNYFKKITIPDYGDLTQLAEKSLGHGLGPLTIMFHLSQEIKNLEKFFRHYLIARQLNDDAHDWEEDLKHGQINAVGAKVLHVISGSDPQRGRPLSEVSWEKLKELFWYEISPQIAEEVLSQTRAAQETLLNLTVIEHREPFLHILKKYEQAANQLIEERQTTLEFLEGYK